MDSVLCDELLQEIFIKLPATPPSSSFAVSLVSKRWLRLFRTSKTSLSLRFSPKSSDFSKFSAVFSQYPFLSSLSVILSDEISAAAAVNGAESAKFDHIMFLISSSCSNLEKLRFLAGPISPFSLIALSRTCTNITSLTISLPRPLNFNWVGFFPQLKELCVSICSTDSEFDGNQEIRVSGKEEIEAELGLETLCLSGVRSNDYEIGFLWRSCKRLRKLHLKSCESIGDAESFSSFIKSVKGLEEIELRKCRCIVDAVLLRLSENPNSLTSLLVYDGGSVEGLLEFVNSGSNLQKLDLRLPLDLNNEHIFAIGANFRSLSTLRLQSCCLVTGEAMKSLGIALSSCLEELALVNCDMVERESGLLASLGQNLRNLRKIDLSYNEMLGDKELVSMLVSCNNVVEVKVRGCGWISGAAMVAMAKSCKDLRCVDVVDCRRIESCDVELFVEKCVKLRRIEVEERKVSEVARRLLSRKFVEVNVCG